MRSDQISIDALRAKHAALEQDLKKLLAQQCIYEFSMAFISHEMRTHSNTQTSALEALQYTYRKELFAQLGTPPEGISSLLADLQQTVAAMTASETSMLKSIEAQSRSILATQMESTNATFDAATSTQDALAAEIAKKAALCSQLQAEVQAQALKQTTFEAKMDRFTKQIQADFVKLGTLIASSHETDPVRSAEASNQVSTLIESVDSQTTIQKRGQTLLTSDAQDIPLETRPFSPSAVVRKLNAAFRPRVVAKQLKSATAKESKLTLDCRVPEKEHSIIGDDFLFSIILANLLANALKFTEVGTVTTEIQQQDIDADTVLLTIRVTDTGIGMTPAEIDKLFGKFAQANTEIGKTYGGSGYGLHLCARLVKRLGGTMEQPISAPGKGTTFTWHMPCPKASPTANPIVIPDNPRRILVAEDISATRKQYTNTLNRYGYAVAAVANGQDAVDYYQASTASDKPFLLIIMDTEMPVLNGPGATTAIRAFEKAQEKPAIPIIALTGNTMASDIAICEAAGATAVLTKPIRLEQLLAALRSLLPKEPPMRESDDAKYSPMSVATTRVSGVDTDNSEPSSPTSSTSETALLLRSPVPPFRSGAAKKPSISSSPDALMGGSQHLHLRERDPNDDRTNEESLATSSSAPPG